VSGGQLCRGRIPPAVILLARGWRALDGDGDFSAGHGEIIAQHIQASTLLRSAATASAWQAGGFHQFGARLEVALDGPLGDLGAFGDLSAFCGLGAFGDRRHRDVVVSLIFRLVVLTSEV
jgi:hypothetical protein